MDPRFFRSLDHDEELKILTMTQHEKRSTANTRNARFCGRNLKQSLGYGLGLVRGFSFEIGGDGRYADGELELKIIRNSRDSRVLALWSEMTEEGPSTN